MGVALFSVKHTIQNKLTHMVSYYLFAEELPLFEEVKQQMECICNYSFDLNSKLFKFRKIILPTFGTTSINLNFFMPWNLF